MCDCELSKSTHNSWLLSKAGVQFIYYRQLGSAAGSSAGIVFTHGPILGFFATQGRHVEPIAAPIAPPCQTLPWSARRWGFTAPKLKKWNFTNIIAPKGRGPCTIFFTKFTGFMRVLSLHNFAKFGCFISINDKIIKKNYFDGAFSAKFLTTPSGKTIDGSQKSFQHKMMARTTLSPCKISWKLRDARRRERTKCDVFCLFVFCI